MAEYWAEFSLWQSEAHLDEATASDWLYAGMSTKLQKEFDHYDTDIDGADDLADWAIKKEQRLLALEHVKKSRPSKTEITPRYGDGTFRPTTKYTPPGEPMDLDATGGRKPNQRWQLPRLSPAEFERRRKEKLCWKCGLKGHFSSNCIKRTVKIRETTTQRGEPQETLNDQSPQ